MFRFSIASLPILCLLSHAVFAIVLDVNNPQSIRDAAATVAHGMQELYNGNQTGGVLGKWPYPPYYWWESGGGWGAMMGYWHYTGDQSYMNVTHQALSSQVGPAYDFVVPQEAFNEGNDDQAFWVFVAMSATEYGFPEPDPPIPSWLTTVENAWNLYVLRWQHDSATCNGGLKWQFIPSMAGYYYKNSISNGAFFQLSARLARYTGNQTYVDWAEKIWDWMYGVRLIDNIYNVFDGSDENLNCSEVDHHQWTYNVGTMLYGSAVLQNYTNSSYVWVERTIGLLEATATFISPFTNATDVMFEAACELDTSCNYDQLSMKAYLSRWLAATSILAPYTAGRVGTLLRTSALGAAAACTGGPFGNTCGTKWYINGYDGTSGLGQQMCALEVMYGLLANETTPPRTLPNVVIGPVPPNATDAPIKATQPSETARPLHDSAGTASQLSHGIGILVSVVALLASITMIW